MQNNLKNKSLNTILDQQNSPISQSNQERLDHIPDNF